MDPEVRRLGALLASLDRRISAVEHAPRLGYTSMESGESLTQYGPDGEVAAVTGSQPDGSYGVVVVQGPIPPAPSAPLVAPGAGMASVRWDGTHVNSLPSPLDLSHLEVYAAKSDFAYLEEADLVGALVGEDGSACVVKRDPGMWHIALVAVSKALKRSAVSERVQVTIEPPADMSGVGAAIEEAIGSAMEGVAEEMAELDEKLGAAFTQGGNAAAAAQEALEAAGQAASAAAAAVVGTVTEYAVSASPTVPPTSGWSTMTPAWAPGSWVWMHAVITYGDGHTATTAPALLTGPPGDPGEPGQPGAPGEPGRDGEDGVSVTSVTSWYRTTTGAAPAQPSGAGDPAGWAQAEPAYTMGTVLWRADRVLYSNGAAQWTPVTKDSSYDAAGQAIAQAQAAAQAAANASTDAGAANAAAAAAAGIAGGKADVLIQPATPGTEYRKATTLWIDTTDGKNIPKRWNGTAWVAVESKVAVDAAATAAAAASAAAAAQNAANAAATAAAEADAKAAGAAGAASLAQSAADAAQNKATAAANTADAANAAAAQAAGIAGGKADVLIQSATPAAKYQVATTLWIDTTGGANTPKRWSGSAWVAVTDKAATDAASAAAAAQGAASAAQSAADAAMSQAQAAHGLAGEALSNAQAAITSANSRNTLYRSTAAPSGTASRVGDMWWRFSDATYSQVIGTWMWSGSAWVASQLAHQVISSVDVGSLTVVGQATLAQAVIDFLWVNVVKAKKITADMMLIGPGANEAWDPYADAGPSIWTNPTNGSIAAAAAIPGHPYGHRLVPHSSVVSNMTLYSGLPQNLPSSGAHWVQERGVPVTPGEVIVATSEWYFTAAPGSASATGAATQVYFYDASGTRLSGSPGNQRSGAAVAPASVPVGEWFTVGGGQITVPAGAAYAIVRPTFYWPGSTAYPTPFEAYVGKMTLLRANAASLIVDGGILARHIDVVDLTAAAAFIERVQALGIKIVNTEGETVIDLTGAGPNYIQITDPSTSDSVATISQDGGVSARRVSADNSLTYRGEEMVDILDARGRGLVAWGYATPGEMRSSNGGRMGLFRLDFEAQPGRLYELRCSPLHFVPKGSTSPSSATLVGTTVNIHLEDNGGTLTVNSPIISYAQAHTYGTGTRSINISGRIFGTHDTQKRVWRLGVSHEASGWHSQIAPWGGQGTIYYSVHDIGPKIPITGGADGLGGTAGDPAPTPPPAVKARFDTTLPMTWWKTYRGTAQYSSSDIIQGYSPYLPYQHNSLLGWGTAIQSALSGADVEHIYLYLHATHWHYNGGGWANIGCHAHSSQPATFSHVGGGDEEKFGKPQARWVRLPDAWYSGFKSGAYRGISLTAKGNDVNYYGRFGTSGGSTPLIRLVGRK